MAKLSDSEASSCTEPTASCLEIPYTELNDGLLKSVVESFVLREGTDYGSREFTLEEKVAQVIRQLERGEAKITYDPKTETVSLLVK